MPVSKVSLLIFRFVIDRTDVNYMALSSNIAIKGTKGGPEKYDIFMKFGSPPTPYDFDQRSTVTASESYVGSVLYRYDNIKWNATGLVTAMA